MAPAALASRSGWPPGKLPVEIFVLIAEHLGRQDLKFMRLVNWEFYKSVSGYFLRQLVVHVGPDLCTSLDAGLLPAQDSPTVDVTQRLVSDVFRVYGDRITRFALALELREYDLASPKVHDDQVLEVRPWGFYRWPRWELPTENTTLQKMKESLENCEGLFQIISRLTNVRELALSCNGGLGYLQGPDLSTPPRRPIVFGAENGTTSFEPRYRLHFNKTLEEETLEKMLRDADVPDELIEVLTKGILEQEGLSPKMINSKGRSRCPLPNGRNGFRPANPGAMCCLERMKRLRLQPDILTRNQKKFLLHHISAQQTMIQSYLLGVLDNASSFENLRKFNIASIPSLHLDILCRNDFWDGLPMLEEVALGVVPDWRALEESGMIIEDKQVYPTDAIPKVVLLLGDYIGKRQHIKHLHFEWLCGGDLACGRRQRNKHILPAPFLRKHRQIINSRLENLMILPHITHLSLKNCWFTPHTFYRIIHEMASKTLVSLELETVSLSGAPYGVGYAGSRAVPLLVSGINPLPQSADPLPIPQSVLNTIPGAAHATMVQGTIQANLSLPSTPNKAVVLPHKLSWLDIIDMLAPGPTVREFVHNRNKKPWQPPLQIQKGLKLRKMAFKSCGYVEVLDDRFIPSWPFSRNSEQYLRGRAAQARNMARNRARRMAPDICTCVDFFMQVNTDRHLAHLTEGMPEDEVLTLNRVHGFTFGWHDGHVYDDAVINAAKNDGVIYPGRGRFTGIIEDEPVEPTPLERYEGVFYPKEQAAPQGDPVHVFDTSPFDRDYDDSTDLDALQSELEQEAGYIQPDPEPVSGEPVVPETPPES